jgi:hypothetical protein
MHWNMHSNLLGYYGDKTAIICGFEGGNSGGEPNNIPVERLSATWVFIHSAGYSAATLQLRQRLPTRILAIQPSASRELGVTPLFNHLAVFNDNDLLCAVHRCEAVRD